MTLQTINPEEAQVGDYVASSYSLSETMEVIESIIHKTHGIKDYPEDYCYLNNLYWEYEYMIVIRIQE